MMAAAWEPGTRRANDKVSAGIYTRTVVRSPVIRWILDARIRDPAHSDAVFVAEDYVEVKEVGQNGYLQFIARKEDFDARILAAAVLNTNDEDAEAAFLADIKQEGSEGTDAAGWSPPQLLVLTLDSDKLVFLALKTEADRRLRFVQCSVPLPHFDRTLFQPGQHLAVDPSSRALAVAAREDHVVLYGTKSRDQLKYELRNSPSRFCPVSSIRPYKVDGVVQHMDFLSPPADSSDEVILLLIVIRQGRTIALRIEWPHSMGPRHAQPLPAQILGETQSVPSLLIPLRDASFCLIEGNSITLWRDILSGSATEKTWVLPEYSPKTPGLSPRSPAWINWARPRRTKAAKRDGDAVYLVREDGEVVWIAIKHCPKSSMNISRAGELECHVGTAFASLGDEGGPDILAIAGETFSGRTVSIGRFFTPRRTEEMSREEALKFEKIQTVPNWAPVMNMISAKELHANRHQTAYTDNALVAAGRQPHGTVTEIRRGLEGRVAFTVPLDILRHAADLWVVPERSMGSIVLVLSSPEGTRLFQIDGDCEAIEEIDEMTAFDLSNATITAGVVASGQLIQVTSHGFCVTESIQGNFEDTVRRDYDDQTLILAAHLLSGDNGLVTVERGESGCSICLYSLTTPDNEPHIQIRSSVPLPSEALCVAAAKVEDTLLVAAATVNGTIEMIRFKSADLETTVITTDLPEPSAKADMTSICDSICILRHNASHEQSSPLSITCGLRDGRIVTFRLDARMETGPEQDKVVTIRDSTVKLVQLNDSTCAAYALSGTDIYQLSWNGSTTSIENIWLSDKASPDMVQPSIIACAQTPQAMWLSSDTMAELLVAVSEDELFFAAVQPITTTLPRQIPVDGTPNRLIHAESLRNIVCSTLFVGVKTFPSSKPHTAPVERRQIWPIIHFIPSSRSGGKTFTHHMQPSDRVNALLEWSYTSPQSDKTYSFILVGGRRKRRNGETQGRLTFLQTSSRRASWEVERVSEIHKTNFADEVHSLAQLNAHTIVIGAGELVYHYAYREESNEWRHIQIGGTEESIRLGSPAIYATVNTPTRENNLETAEIIISTARDSLVVLNSTSGETVAMGPHAQNLLTHYIPPGLFHRGIDAYRSALVTTRTGEVSQLSWPAGQEGISATLDFTAKLRRSLTRLIPSAPPARKEPPPAGLRSERLVGSAADGALVVVQLIDIALWERLSWLQRLIEWSPVLSPHSQDAPMYDRTGGESGISFPERGMPIGLGKRDKSQLVPLQARSRVEHDLHIDGDILARILDSPDGMEEVKDVMSNLATETNAVGRWMSEHLDREMEALEEVVGVVRDLERWIM